MNDEANCQPRRLMHRVGVATAAALLVIASGVQAGDHWLSRVTVKTPSQPDTLMTANRAASAGLMGVMQTSSTTVFDITISLDTNPQGDDNYKKDPNANDAQNAYEKRIEEFARAVYQSTNGAHKIGKVTVFRSTPGEKRVDSADVRWNENCADDEGPRANLSGRGVAGMRIWMCTNWTGSTSMSTPKGSGYTLAHEWGHFTYGLYDEYAQEQCSTWTWLCSPSTPRATDTAAVPAIMNNQWIAASGTAPAGYAGSAVDFLEHSTQNIHPYRSGSTGTNGQQRMFGESAWQTLTRDPATDPKYFWSPIPPRTQYTTLIAPADPSWLVSNDESSALSELDIRWVGNQAMDLSIDRSGSMDGTPLANAKTGANLLIDQIQPGTAIGVSSFETNVARNLAITKIPDPDTGVKASAQAAVNALSTGGMTSLYDGLMFSLNALQTFDPNRTGLVYVLSDGGDNDSTATEASVISAYQAAGVPIIAFAYGSYAPTGTLLSMANATQGAFYQSPITLADIQKVLVSAQARFSSNVLLSSAATGAAASATTTRIVAMDSTLASVRVNLSYTGSPADFDFSLLRPDGSDSGVFFACEGTVSCSATLDAAFVAANGYGDYQVQMINKTGTRKDVTVLVSATPSGAETYDIAVGFSSSTLSYPTDMAIRATVTKGAAIAGLDVIAIVTGPPGNTFNLALLDDGIGADQVANDGTYSASIPYTANGIYSAIVTASNAGAKAQTTFEGVAVSLRQDGTAVMPTPTPITENFTRVGTASASVAGVLTDDHANSPTGGACTAIADNNADTAGRIDAAGDVDCFRFVPSSLSDPTIVRVTSLTSGMDPVLTIYDHTGRDQIAQVDLSSSESPGSGVTVTVSAGDLDPAGLVFVVKHIDVSAIAGGYAVSAGTPLASDRPIATLYALTVGRTGTGSGTIGGGGSFGAGATVTLTATAATGSTFSGWSPTPCAASFPMPATDLTCTATFVRSNQAPTGTVTISGTAARGQTLTAANTLADADGLGPIGYQWLANGSAIGGATGGTLLLGQAQVGKTISVTASYTDGAGTAESRTSAATAVVTSLNHAPTGTVTLSGTPTQGQTLTAANTLADVDGLGTIDYQWLADGSPIGGATGGTLVLGQAQVGKTIRVTAGYTDGGDTLESVTSAATAAVANVNDPPTGTVTLSGTAAQGRTLTAVNSLADADGLGTISYQWLADGSPIDGAVGGTLLLRQAQVGKAISVTAGYTDGGGTAESMTSAATAAVADVNQAPTGTVTISGTAIEDQTLAAANTLADDDGLGTIAYQWLADGSVISGATDSTLVLGQAQVGKAISVAAGYTDGGGTAERVTSGATTPVVHVNHAPTGAVTISGAAAKGRTLTAANTLADLDGLGTIRYQWVANRSSIAGATGSTLVLTQAQVGMTISVIASYTDGGGTAESKTSTATAVVTNINHPPTGAVTLSGTATQGRTLSAANTLADADGLGTIGYQWLADGSAISGATGSTLALGQAQVGKAISVTAGYTDGLGGAESVTSRATAAVTNVNDTPTGTVTISGIAAQDQTLIAANTLSDLDGLGVIGYQWLADGTAITGATRSTFALTQAQVGKAISVKASYTDGGGTAESVTSSATAVVTNSNHAPLGSVGIIGTATQGRTLTASNTLADIDGLGAISYQWLADGGAIAGASGTKLVLAQAQVGKTISVKASYTDGGGTAESKISGATAAVANVNDAPSGAVTVTGTAAQGRTLTASNTLTDLDGLGAIGYQWLADGSTLAGATAATFTPTPAQGGKAISVKATYTDGFGTAESVTSSATAAVASFDALSYIASYPDLIQAFGTNAEAGVDHYVKRGFTEGRRISFDGLSYIASYPDLIQSFGSDAQAGVRHYIQWGFAEGRRINFDGLSYIASYPDLTQAFGDDAQAGVLYYIKWGFAAGHPVIDGLRYIASYGDLIQAFGTNSEAGVEHYVRWGFTEGRRLTFDPLHYIASYGDLIQAFGTNAEAGILHYIKWGFAEGRRSTFDPESYLAKHGDLRSAFGTDLVAATYHFILFGYAEGRAAGNTGG